MIYLINSKKVVNKVRIENRWIVFLIFLISSIIVLISLNVYKNEKSVDLSELKINDLQLSQQFNNSDYQLNHKIKLDRYRFYTHKKYKNLIVKVQKHSNKIKGIVLINHSNITTNFGVQIGDSIDQAIMNLGESYKKTHQGKKYKSITYFDKQNHMKLSILYKDNSVKRLEFFSR